MYVIRGVRDRDRARQFISRGLNHPSVGHVYLFVELRRTLYKHTLDNNNNSNESVKKPAGLAISLMVQVATQLSAAGRGGTVSELNGRKLVLRPKPHR